MKLLDELRRRKVSRTATFHPLRADPRFIRILEALRLPVTDSPEPM